MEMSATAHGNYPCHNNVNITKTKLSYILL